MSDLVKMRLEAIRDRYFRGTIAFPEGDLCHHGDCNTHRAMEIYKYAPCSCGLLHDLKIIDDGIVDKIFPRWKADSAKHDAMVPGHRYWTGPLSDEEVKNNEKFLERFFGTPVSYPPEELESMMKEEWELIEEVFGKVFCNRMKGVV